MCAKWWYPCQLYNAKIAQRFGHAPTDEYPLCHKPDSCTHIAGECTAHEALRISRYNALCQLVHAAILKTAKEVDHLFSIKIENINETVTTPEKLYDEFRPRLFLPRFPRFAYALTPTLNIHYGLGKRSKGSLLGIFLQARRKRKNL